MKKQFHTIAIWLIVLAISLGYTSCKKNDSLDPVRSTQFQFVVDSLPGALQNSSELYAMVSIRSGTTEIISNKKLKISFNGKYITEKLALPLGNYKLSKFIINNNLHSTRFATPMANSAKASLVQKPLTIDYALSNLTVLNIPVEVAKVDAADSSESFGYPGGTFNQPVENPDLFFHLKLKASITIGDVVYDNIPADLNITSWDSSGTKYEKAVVLVPGVNNISILKSHSRYSFKISKWGITDQLALVKAEVNENTIYTLGGYKTAKKLKAEAIERYINGTFVPFTDVEYEYDNSNRLKQIKSFVHGFPVNIIESYGLDSFVYTDHHSYVYSKKYSAWGELKESSTTQFDYLNPNRLLIASEFHLNNQHEYFTYAYNKQNAVNNIKILGVNKFGIPNGSSILQIFVNDNLQQEKITSSQQNHTNTYEYDFNINPYRQMNWPKIQFETSSKNNVLHKQKNGTPNQKNDYTYDADGYVTQMITLLWDAATNQYKPHSKIRYIY